MQSYLRKRSIRRVELLAIDIGDYNQVATLEKRRHHGQSEAVGVPGDQRVALRPAVRQRPSSASNLPNPATRVSAAFSVGGAGKSYVRTDAETAMPPWRTVCAVGT